MPTLKIIFAIISVIVNCYAFYPYIRDIFLKITKPHVYTWLIWLITQSTAVAGIWYGRGGIGAIELIIGTLLIPLVLIFSIKNGTKNIRLIDTICLIFALIAIFTWWQLHNPILSVFMVCCIDVLGYIPTLRKSYKEPWGETLASWVLFSIADVFAIGALHEYNFLTVAYLSTIITLNLSLVIFCTIRRKKVMKPVF